MAQVRCVDGSVLTVRAVPVLDRDGAQYELTLELLRDGDPFGAVGERCGWFLAEAAARLRSGFAASTVEAGVRAWARDREQDPDEAWAALRPYLPRDRELLAFRSRDPDDLATVGELRVTLEEQRRWVAGRWETTRCAVLQAWGSDGTGVRAVLSPPELLALLDALV